MFSFIGELIGEVIGGFVLEILGGMTGHALVACVTLGSGRVSDDTAALIGIVFWIAVGVGCYRVFG